jgi:hypothetical protein
LGPAKARAASRRRIAAVALAMAAHVAMLGLLLTGGGRVFLAPLDLQRPTEVWLAPPLILRPPMPQPQVPRSEPQSPSARQPAPTAAASPGPAAPSPTTSPSGPSTAPPSPNGEGLAASLRKWVGCAHPDAAWMSDAERDACRERLASGAESAPHLQGMPATKLAYFTAVAKAQADWASGRDAGHGPGIGCMVHFGPGKRLQPPPHALVLGPCMIEPPRGSLDVDVDILPDGSTPETPPAFVTSRTRAP